MQQLLYYACALQLNFPGQKLGQRMYSLIGNNTVKGPSLLLRNAEEADY